MTLRDFLIKKNIIVTDGELKRLISNKAIFIDNQLVTDTDLEIEKGIHTIKVGKKIQLTVETE